MSEELETLLQHICCYDEEEVRALINGVRAEAVRNAASGLVDWDIMNGQESPTAESNISHSNAAYLMRVADDFERGGH